MQHQKNSEKDNFDASAYIDPDHPRFIKTENGEALVEAILSLWDIDDKGQIMKKKEVSFEYKRTFSSSTEEKMRLQLCDKK